MEGAPAGDKSGIGCAGHKSTAEISEESCAILLYKQHVLPFSGLTVIAHISNRSHPVERGSPQSSAISKDSPPKKGEGGTLSCCLVRQKKKKKNPKTEGTMRLPTRPLL